MVSNAESIIPKAFIWRRIHSLLGFWLVLYLFLHLLTNSQAALWIGDNGLGFVRLVNFLESLPYLHVIEIGLIGIPLLIHGILGIKYALSGKFNAHKTKGNTPSLPQYSRNHAYIWQRITSWILLFGIVGHVVQMRFLDFPREIIRNGHHEFLVKLNFDRGLYTVAEKQGIVLFSKEEIDSLHTSQPIPKDILMKGNSIWKDATPTPYDPDTQSYANEIVKTNEEQKWIQAMKSFRLKDTQVVAVAQNSGKAMLLSVRNTFKSPLMIALYSIFVFAAVFHACNGLWTSLITWGALLNYKSQKFSVPLCMLAMCLLLFFGFASIWGTYWVNLRY